jgi:hypothetical protein
MMSDNEEFLEFFRCYVCSESKSVKVLKQVSFRDQIFKKDVCTDCYNKMIGKFPEKKSVIEIKKEMI